MQEIENNPFLFEEEKEINIKTEIFKYLKFWPWFVLGLLISVTISYFYLRYAPRIYQTTTKIKVLDEKNGLEFPSAAFVFQRSNINLENEIEILKSYRILEKVVRRLELTSRFYEEGRIQTSEIDKLPFNYEQTVDLDSITSTSQYKISVNDNEFFITNLSSKKIHEIPFNNNINNTLKLPFKISSIDSLSMKKVKGKKYIVKISPVKSTSLRLKNIINIDAVGEGSHLLSLGIKGESPLKSEIILNTLIDEFNNDGIKDRQLVSQKTLDFIDERFILLATELDSIEVDKKDFKKSNNLIDLPTDAEMSLTQKTKTEEEVFKLENQLAISDLLEETLVNSISEENKLLPSNIGLTNNAVNILVQDYNTAIIEKEKLTSSAGLNNPSVLILSSTIKDLRSNLKLSLNSYKKQLRISLNQINSRNLIFKSQVSKVPEKEKLLREIERQQSIKENLYLILLQKREEAAINLEITEPSIKVVEYAISGSLPISPKRNIVYLAAILAGILIPFGIIYIIFLFDTKLHSKIDIEKIFPAIPVVAEIPKIKGENNIFTNPNDRSGLAEAFRILSSNTNYILPQNDKGKIILCTSTIKGEGKTFVSLNLSLALSSLNKKVLLIGADLRNPQVHSYLNLDKNEIGLSNYLHDTSIDWKSNLIRGFNKHPNHFILLSGSLPPNPAHLLTNGRFEKLLEEAKQEFDYVIVDTAPTILVTDTLLISQLADATLYMTRANFTEKSLLDHSIELHKKKKLKNMAYVINAVGAHKSYGYNYGYEYGYE